MKHYAPLLISFALLITSLPAQVETPKKASATDATAKQATAKTKSGKASERKAKKEPRAVAALASLSGKAWHFTGTTGIVPPKREAEGGMMMMVGGPPRAKPYQGGMEILRTAKGELLVASAKAYPGVALFQLGAKSMARVTAPVDERLDVAGLNADLSVLLKSAEVLAWAKKDARWRTKVDAEAGRTSFTVKIPAAVLDSEEEKGAQGGEMIPEMMDPMASRILFTHLQLTVDAKDQVVSVEVRVTWNDPEAMMMEIAGEGGEIDMEDLMDADPVPGAVHRYRFSSQGSLAPSRAGLLLKSFRDLIR